MNREKYPNYFLTAAIIYGLTFIFWFGTFFVPVSAFGLDYSDFYLITGLLFLPILLFAVYSQSSRLEFLWGKESILRYIICTVIVIDALFVFYMMLWLF